MFKKALMYIIAPVTILLALFAAFRGGRSVGNISFEDEANEKLEKINEKLKLKNTSLEEKISSTEKTIETDKKQVVILKDRIKKKERLLKKVSKETKIIDEKINDVGVSRINKEKLLREMLR